MQNKVLIWDLPIRIFHWLLVAAFIVAFISEDDFLTIHVWAGYLIAGLLIFRLVWGFIGNRYARFSNFICPLAESSNYFKDVITLKAKRYLGHNPAGALMIVLLLISLLLTVLSGFAVYGADQGAGPLANMAGSSYKDLWEEVHEFFANFTLLLIIIHIIGVLLESFVHAENLVRSMWNGYKKLKNDD
ncbi:MAG: cytochrome b/b6 domain-containing protein [Methylococcales bacterium]|nr:cytochrome b/b6 domain-containing protein [Methylococcales bacterium]